MRAASALFLSVTVLLPNVSQGAMVTLDFISGTYSAELAPPRIDTYRQDGFKLQVERVFDHIDPVDPPYLPSPLFFHNNVAGALDPDNDLILTFNDGEAFDFVGIDIAGFRNSAPSLDLIASNGATASFSTTGFKATPAFTNITSVIFSIPFSGPFSTNEIVDLGRISVDDAPSAVPEPSSLALLGAGALGLLGFRNRRRRVGQTVTDNT